MRCFCWLGDLPSVLWHCWLGDRKGIQPVENWVVGCWSGCLSGARCRLAYGPAYATATLSLASVKSRLLLPFWYRLTRVVPDKGPLNRSVCVCVCVWLMLQAGKAGQSVSVLELWLGVLLQQGQTSDAETTARDSCHRKQEGWLSLLWVLKFYMLHVRERML